MGVYVLGMEVEAVRGCGWLGLEGGGGEMVGGGRGGGWRSGGGLRGSRASLLRLSSSLISALRSRLNLVPQCSLLLFFPLTCGRASRELACFSMDDSYSGAFKNKKGRILSPAVHTSD